MNVTDWIDAAKARADAATEGPWFAHDCGQSCCVWVNGEERSTTSDPEDIAGVDTPETAAFIAAARTDLPKALDALRAVEYIAAKDIARQPDDWADDIALTAVLDARAAAARDYLAAIANTLGVQP